MIRKKLLLPFMAFVVSSATFAEKTERMDLSSPNGVHKVMFYSKISTSGANGLFYNIEFKDKQVLQVITD